jgi:capsular polysaccharide biosynthesis protein
MLSEKEQRSDGAEFMTFIRINSKKLLLFSLFGGLAAFLATFLIPKEYRSYAVVYPPSSTAIESSIDFPNFGYDVEADRLIQILESREIRDSVFKRFDLENYYDVDKSNPAWHDAAIKRYSRDIKFERTTSMAVIISARSEDPELSAKIVNYIIECADKFREKIYKVNIIPAYEHALAEYQLQKTKVDTAETVLIRHLKEHKLSSLLLLMSDAQISINLDRLNSDGDAAAGTPVGGEIVDFKSSYRVMEEAKGRMLKIRKTLDNPIPKLFVIHAGEPYYKKVGPSFSVNALAGALISLLIAASVLLVRRSRDSSRI